MRSFAATIFAASLVFAGYSHAQLNKCMGPDGKVSYSDKACATNSTKKEAVQIQENTLDGSSARQDVQNVKIKEAVQGALQVGSGKCRFYHYAVGGEMGKQLAVIAKEECLANIAARISGQP
jgi:hypothetical protein